MTSTSTDSAAPVRVRRRSSKKYAVVVTLAVVGLLVAAGLIGRLSTAAPKPPGADVGLQLNTPLPRDIATAPLIDEFGNNVNLDTFKGKLVVMTDFLTTCQEICPITTAVLNQVDEAVMKAGLADKVQFVDVTVDPGRDDPQRLRAYRDFAKLQPNWTLLTGTQANLDVLFTYFGISYEKTSGEDPPATDWLTGKPLTYDVAHSDVLIFLDQQGKQRFVMQGAPLGSNAPLTTGERAFLNDEGRDNLNSPSESSWTGDQALQVVSWLAKKHIRAVD